MNSTNTNALNSTNSQSFGEKMNLKTWKQTLGPLNHKRNSSTIGYNSQLPPKFNHSRANTSYFDDSFTSELNRENTFVQGQNMQKVVLDRLNTFESSLSPNVYDRTKSDASKFELSQMEPHTVEFLSILESEFDGIYKVLAGTY